MKAKFQCQKRRRKCLVYAEITNEFHSKEQLAKLRVRPANRDKQDQDGEEDKDSDEDENEQETEPLYFWG